MCMQAAQARESRLLHARQPLHGVGPGLTSMLRSIKSKEYWRTSMQIRKAPQQHRQSVPVIRMAYDTRIAALQC